MERCEFEPNLWDMDFLMGKLMDEPKRVGSSNGEYDEHHLC